MREMIDLLGDEHSTYFSPKEAQAEDEDFAGQYDYVGVGIWTNVDLDRQRLIVVLVFPGGPAEMAGIKARDSILAVDGQLLVEGDEIRRDLMLGEEGALVTLTVQTPGEAPREVSILRQRISGSWKLPAQVFTTPGDKRIGYIFLHTFFDETVPEAFEEALRELNAEGPLDGLILDNRENGGGESGVMRSVLGFFTRGTIGYFIDRDRQYPVAVNSRDLQGSQNLPLVVLVGPNTVSFAEIFAGVLQETGRAVIIGQQTDGNVEIMLSYSFQDGSRIWLAHETFAPASNPEVNWEETGIIPDQVVEGRWEDDLMEDDPVILAALRHFDSP